MFLTIVFVMPRCCFVIIFLSDVSKYFCIVIIFIILIIGSVVIVVVIVFNVFGVASVLSLSLSLSLSLHLSGLHILP